MSQHSPGTSDTREQILRTGRELLMTRSYLGFSFQDVADRVGIRKASLYHHFATKDALAIAILQESRVTFERWVGRMQLPAAKKLEAYIRMYRDALGAGRVMCPAGSMIPGWDCMEDGVKHEVQLLRQAQIDWLAQLYVELGEKPARAKARASHMFGVCQGALATSRITGDAGDFDEIIATARRGAPLSAA